ncbi:hypothetical protein HKX48_004470 [Thoreauomyces humboldtii]|nr:hypothetical protein HKX48_004470 [Thoreauomyces humboldtii]
MSSTNAARTENDLSESDDDDHAAEAARRPSTDALPLQPQVPLKRSRASRACDTCRKKRTKCSGELPCAGCHAFGFHCHYTDTVRRKGPMKKNTIKTLESRLQMMESLMSGGSREGENGSSTSPPLVDAPNGRNATGNRQMLPRPRSSFSKENTKRLKLENQGNLLVVDAVGSFTMYQGRSAFPIYQSPRYRDGILTLPFKIIAQDIHSAESPNNLDSLRQMLPFTHEQIMKLSSTYFQVVHPFLPIVDRATFFRTLAEGPDSHPFRALLYSILIVACHYSGQLDVSHDTIDMLCDKTQQILVDFEVSHVWIAQAALVLTMACNLRAERPFKPIKNKWRLVGIAIRCAQELGLHRNLHDIVRPLRLNDPSATEETRRRTWAGCYVLDRKVSVFTGRPCMIHDEDWDALAPQGYSEIEEERADAEYLRHHMAFAEITGMLLQRVNSARGVWKRGKAEGGNEMVQDMQMRLEKWRDELPADLSLNTVTDPKRPFKRRELLHASFHTAVLISRRALLGRYDAEARRSTIALIDILETIVNKPADASEGLRPSMITDFPTARKDENSAMKHYLFPGSAMSFLILWDALLAEVTAGDKEALKRMDRLNALMEILAPQHPLFLVTMGLMADTLNAHGIESRLTRWALKARDSLHTDMFSVDPTHTTPSSSFDDEDDGREGSNDHAMNDTSPAPPPSAWFTPEPAAPSRSRADSMPTASTWITPTPTSEAQIPSIHTNRMLPPPGHHGGNAGHPSHPSIGRHDTNNGNVHQQPLYPAPQISMLQQPPYQQHQQQQQQQQISMVPHDQSHYASQYPYPPMQPSVQHDQNLQPPLENLYGTSQPQQLPQQPPVPGSQDFLTCMFGDLEDNALWDLMGFV